MSIASGADSLRRVVARGGEVLLARHDQPALRSGEVMVQTLYSVISPGTERSVIAATIAPGWESLEYPAAGQTWRPVRSASVRHSLLGPREPATDFASLGYSLAGKVIAVAVDVADVEVGDLVACSGSQCAFHADRVSVPRNLTVKVPSGLGAERAAFVTLGAIALEALRRSRVVLGETVVIFGCGVLGVLITLLARCAGVYVIAVDPEPARRRIASQAGAMAALDPGEADLAELVRAGTGGFGADAALVTVTTEKADVVNSALASLRPNGVVIGVGQFGMSFDRDQWFGSQATLVPSVAYGPGRYDPVYEENNWDFPIGIVRWTENRNMELFLRLVAEKEIDLDQVPVVRVPLERATEAYSALAANRLPLTGVLCYQDAGEESR